MVLPAKCYETMSRDGIETHRNSFMPVSIALPAASDSPDSVLCHQLRDIIAVALRTFDMSERKEQFALTTSEGKRIHEGTPKLAH